MFTAITVTVLIAYFMEGRITVETLVVPSNCQPSCPSARGWFINPFIFGHFHTWEYFAAIIPAGLVWHSPHLLILLTHLLITLLSPSLHLFTPYVFPLPSSWPY